MSEQAMFVVDKCPHCCEFVFGKTEHFKRHKDQCIEEFRDEDFRFPQPASFAEEKRVALEELAEARKHPLKLRERFFLISSTWFQIWKDYDPIAGTARPGAIDNTMLLEDGVLKKGLQEGYDYEILPACVWFCFRSWYGVREAEVLLRRVLPIGFLEIPQIELYPITLHFVFGDAPEPVLKYSFSAVSSLAAVKAYIVNYAGHSTAPHHCTLHIRGTEGDIEVTREQQKLTLEELSLKDGTVLKVTKPADKRAGYGGWVSSDPYSGSGGSRSYSTWTPPPANVVGRPELPGQVAGRPTNEFVGVSVLCKKLIK